MHKNELQIKCNSFFQLLRRDRNSLIKKLKYKINVIQNSVAGNRAAMRNELQKNFFMKESGIFMRGAEL